MDEIDVALEEAFVRLVERMRVDRRELLVRLRRRRKFVERPLRAWCICLRASDWRIVHERTAFFNEGLAAARQRHTVELPGWGIRQLVLPVEIRWPGLRLRDAARKLGKHPEVLQRWVRRKVLHVEYDYCRPHGYRGRKCPVVWSDRPLDPNAQFGRGPNEAWSTMWHRHAERIPDEFVCAVDRLAYRVKGMWRGWDWICPGLEGRPCGRRARRLYAPVSVWTLDRALVPVLKFVRGQQSQEVAEFLEALPRALRDPWAGRRTLACDRCWRIQTNVFVGVDKSWNQFVTCISGGLLTGREVAMPWAYRRMDQRRRAYRPHAGYPPSRRRAQVLELLLNSRLTLPQIARRLGIGRATLGNHVHELYRRHNVHSRAQLAQACGRQPLELEWQAAIESRRRKVGRLVAAGLTTPRIAAKLGLTEANVRYDIRVLHRRYATGGARASLIASLAGKGANAAAAA